MTERIVIVEYDAGWPARFEAERAAIAAACGDALAAIEHVGSTAVPGCPAKPVIDIMAGLREQAGGERCIVPLEVLGYEYRGESGIPGRYYFRKGEPRSYHVHMVTVNSGFWRRHVAFRDILRARPDLVSRYGALKRELAERWGDDRVGYTDAKSPFIEEVLSQAPPAG